MTSGLGLIVSKFPLGICSTTLIVLGTATTILDPLSTRRFSQSALGRSWLLPDVSSDASAVNGAKVASCAFVVYMTSPEATVNDVVLYATSGVEE